MKSHRNNEEYTISVRDIAISWSLNASSTLGLNHTTITQIRNVRKLRRNCSLIVRLYNAEIPPLPYNICLPIIILSLFSLADSFSRVFTRMYIPFSQFFPRIIRAMSRIFPLIIAWDAHARRPNGKHRTHVWMYESAFRLCLYCSR